MKDQEQRIRMQDLDNKTSTKLLKAIYANAGPIKNDGAIIEHDLNIVIDPSTIFLLEPAKSGIYFRAKHGTFRWQFEDVDALRRLHHQLGRLIERAGGAI